MVSLRMVVALMLALTLFVAAAAAAQPIGPDRE
jgi:hypothetical protein